ncbi:unnamed protein product [Urochloa decumbens]|uniref:F-box domain-containing protein n=1 Tax=Urochloa decumbens TaxID=240449 RepID=A0ABC9D9Q8_9POAL
MPPPPPVLMEELVEEILLRVPPTEPATLVRAALVCRPWRSLVSGTGFRRQYREFHRAPPLLGVLCNNYGNRRTSFGPYLSRFVPTSSFRAPVCGGYRALEARHGRVLLRLRMMGNSKPCHLIVWDPVMGEQWQLTKEEAPVWFEWNAAVLCARAGACDHLDCGGGPFIVVTLGMHNSTMSLCVYSSEDGSWTKPAYVAWANEYGNVDEQPTALVGNTLYFRIKNGTRVLGYDMATRETYVVQLPPKDDQNTITLITVEGGGLGVAILHLDETAKLSLWSMEVSPNGDMGWIKVSH